ncbi:hypothetical protein THIX_60568 [Thiomonas sp. X19]|uniref:Crp/Fnr family transcriptional regulator n=1 Tax=Thiomonas sp. X19 TaxID=1050370 RepID=UPI000B6E3180|nr:Crp/Fnr family transcriptional regulator [Thiomonas sp. X19]SCC94510.1 hypothetical protein THIX_60568 [Thiomonas sp. X19]
MTTIEATGCSLLLDVQHSKVMPAPLWRSASANAKAAIFKAGNIAEHISTLSEGESLYNRGEPMGGLYVLMRGVILVSLKQDRKKTKSRKVMDLAMEGDVLGAAGYAEGVHTADALAMRSCTASLIMPQAWARTVERDSSLPTLAMLAGSELSRALRHNMRLRLGAMARLADFILQIDEKRGLDAPGAGLSLPLSKRDLANYLDLWPETLSRTFKKMEALGCFRRVGRTHLYELDSLGLREIRATSRCRQA